MEEMTMTELIMTLERLKCAVEWDYPMDYQIALDKVIKLLRYINGQSKEADGQTA